METFLSGNLDQVPIKNMLVSMSHLPSHMYFAMKSLLFVHSNAPPYQLSWDHSLVGANTGSLKSFGTQLFVLVGNHVDTERELIDIRTLSAKVEDTNLGIRYTTVEPGLWVRL